MPFIKKENEEERSVEFVTDPDLDTESPECLGAKVSFTTLHILGEDREIVHLTFLFPERRFSDSKIEPIRMALQWHDLDFNNHENDIRNVGVNDIMTMERQPQRMHIGFPIDQWEYVQEQVINRRLLTLYSDEMVREFGEHIRGAVDGITEVVENRILELEHGSAATARL